VTENSPPVDERDEDLVRRAARGDAAAFARLVDRYKNGVHYLAVRMVGPEEAEDIAQEAFGREDLAARVRALVDRLPEPYRAALTLHYLGELRYEEVAAAMEVPLGTVKTLLHRGKSRLRDLVVREIGFAEEMGPSAKDARG
jgi:DNA-directed RNA polymerase specialized sigma24 family protein